MRCVFLGDSGIGKTTFLKKAIHDESNTGPTIGVNSMVYISGKDKLHCWDTSGTRRFERVSLMFANGADAIIYMYDVSTPSTLDRVLHWRQLADAVHNTPNVHILVGLKTDLENKCPTEGYENFLWINCPTENQTMEAIVEIIKSTRPKVTTKSRQSCCF